MRKRLSKWKGRNLSLGGIIVLIKSVLSSLLLYYFSFFRALIKVLRLLTGIQRSFLCGVLIVEGELDGLVGGRIVLQKF